MTWGEAYRLTQILAADPSSQVGAALANLTHAVTREALVLMDLFDLTHQAAWASGGGKGSRPKPYPRPLPSRQSRRAKPDAKLTQDEIIAALRMAGHTAPIPMV